MPMKKNGHYLCALLLVAAVIFSSVLPRNFNTVYAANQSEETIVIKKSGRRVSVSGVSDVNANITIDVYKVDNEQIVYHDQMLSNGRFEFVFLIPKAEGKYTVKCNNGTDVITKEIDYEQFTAYIVNDDFDKYVSGTPTGWSADQKNALTAEKTQYNQSLKIDWRSSTVTLLKQLSTQLTSSLYHISYDVSAMEAHQNFALKVYDRRGKDYLIAGINSEGKAGVCSENSAVDYGRQKCDYAINEFIRFDIYASIEKRIFVVCCNGRTVGVKQLGEEFTGISRISFERRASSGGYTLLDNVTLAEVDSKYENFMNQSNTDILKTAAELSTDKTGNNFFGHNNAAVRLNVNNLTGNNINARINCVAVNHETKESMEFDAGAVTLQAYGDIETEVDISHLPFALYEVYVCLKNGEKTIGKAAVINIAIINSSANNEKNENAGINFPQLFEEKYTDDEMNCIFEMIDNAGFGLIRSTLYWNLYEKNKGDFILPRGSGKFLDKCRNKNLKLMTVLGFTNPNYPDIFTEGSEEINSEAVGAFNNYIAKTNEEIGNVTKYYEMWNEPDLLIRPKAYAEFVKSIYPRLKEVAPDIPSGGISLSNPWRSWFTTSTLNAYAPDANSYDWTVGMYMDAISLHNYTRYPEERNREDADPTDGLGMTIWGKSKADEVRTANGKNALPMWCTEHGWFTDETIDGYTDESTVAKYSPRVFLYNEGFNGIDLSIQHVLLNMGGEQADYNNSIGAPNENSCGILLEREADVPFAAKPAFLSLCNYNTMLAGKKLAEAKEDNGAYLSRYTGKNGDMYAVWTKSDTARITINGMGQYVKIYDIYGNAEIIESNNGSVTVTASDSVNYIENTEIFDGFIVNGAKTSAESMNFDDINSISAAVTVRAEEYGSNENLCLICAQYGGDGSLVSIDVREIPIPNGDNFKYVELPFKIKENAEVIKIFKWDSLDSMVSLGDRYVLSNAK